MGIEFAPRQRDAIVELALALLRSDIEAAESAERQHHGRDRDTRAA